MRNKPHTCIIKEKNNQQLQNSFEICIIFDWFMYLWLSVVEYFDDFVLLEVFLYLCILLLRLVSRKCGSMAFPGLHKQLPWHFVCITS